MNRVIGRSGHRVIAKRSGGLTFRSADAPITRCPDYSRNATDCTPETSKRLRQRMFLHITMSSLRTM